MITFQDPSTLPQASVTYDPSEHGLEAFCEQCGHMVDAVCPKCGNQVAALESVDRATGSNLSRSEFYRRFISMVQSARNSKFTLGCYLIATGDGYADGVSLTEFAKTWGVGKATVSKQCRLICAYLGLAPSRYMKSEETARKFRLSNRRPRKTDETQRRD